MSADRPESPHAAPATQDLAASLLVLGGARSGKSRHAQAVAEQAGGRRVFIATAQALDAEMTERIARHRVERDTGWTTVEAPLDLVEAVAANDCPGTTLLVDCLTLWASNLLLADRPIEPAADALVERLSRMRARIVLVSNEVGYGIVPDNALARVFRDRAGTLNQRIAGAVARVELVVAGLPLRLKG